MKSCLRFSILACLSLTFAFVFPASATDIQGGETFANGESLTGSRLNNLVSGATILPGFLSGKSTASPVAADSFLFYQAGSGTLLRSTLSSLQTAIWAVPTFTGVTTVSQSFIVSGVLSPSQITANQDNYNPTDLATSTTLRLTTDAARTITGLAGGASGRMIIAHNIGSFNITISDEGGTSTAGNRFALTSDLVLRPDQVAAFQYDSTSARWRHVGSRPALKSYLQLAAPQKVDGTGAVMQASSTATYNGQAKFTNSADQAANYAEYRFIVPTDIDTSVDLKARLKFQLSGADTGKHRYVLSVSSVADSAAYAGSLGNAVNMDFTGDASGASGDVESVGQTTLTGWKAALTAGQLFVVRLARDGDDGTNDTSTVDSYSGPIEIEYSPTGQ